MANRAYLYAADTLPATVWKLPEDGEYFDSRWTIPISWWFLFSPPDLHFINVQGHRTTWSQLRFVTDRMAALDRFASHRALLISVIGQQLETRYLDFFIAVLREWPGRYLLLKPDEVFDYEAADDAKWIISFLSALEKRSVAAETVLDRIKTYSSIRSPDQAEAFVVGYTYGQTGRKLWNQMMPAP